MDFYNTFRSSLTSPGSVFFDVIPDDANDLDVSTRGIIVATAGNLMITGVGMPDGTKTLIPNLVAGAIHAIRAKRIWDTDSTATGIVGTY